MSVSDSAYLERCRELIQERLNWLTIEDLKQSDFQYLSELVFEKTKTQLSLSTIKRLWDKTYDKSFQITTLNTLAKFLEYANWHQFKELNYDIVNKQDEKLAHRSKNYKKAVKPLIIVFILFGIVAFIAIFSYNNENIVSGSEHKNVLFTSKKSVKEGVPNTIIFNYNVSTFDSDSMCIQLSWNDKEREAVNKSHQYYTCTYYYPGYHHAKLIVNNEIIKEHEVHITTKDWLALVRYEPEDVIPTYIRNSEVISNGKIYASPDLLKQNNVDLNAKEFYVSYFNVQDFKGLSADSFSFETELMNNRLEPGLICQNCIIMIYAEYGAIVLPISSKGCVSDIGVFLSEVFKSGKNNDLSGFGCDLSGWRKISCTVIDKKMKVTIDEQFVYELSYKKPLGKIKGWHYFFKGCGAVNYLWLYDRNKNIVFSDDFNR